MWGLSGLNPSRHWVRLSSTWGPSPSPANLTLTPGKSDLGLSLQGPRFRLVHQDAVSLRGKASLHLAPGPGPHSGRPASGAAPLGFSSSRPCPG